jgi:superfamily II DNA or RNA helicase/HKD family nuclease
MSAKLFIYITLNLNGELISMLELGIYEQLINKSISQQLDNLSDQITAKRSKLTDTDSPEFLGYYLGKFITRILGLLDSADKSLESQITLSNEIIKFLLEYLSTKKIVGKNDELFEIIENYLLENSAEVLLSVSKNDFSKSKKTGSDVIRPTTSLRNSSLFTGSPGSPNMLSELKKEILSSNSIDLLISFIKLSGLRLIYDDLKQFLDNGGRLRVLTTSYMGATDLKAIEQLSKLPNTEIKISYDIGTTRLHAKSYIFKRNTGFDTTYIGSSNLSEPAITRGLEWNLKLTSQDSLHIIEKVNVTFEHYWNSPEFEFYTSDDYEKLAAALKYFSQKNDSSRMHFFDIQPYYYQQEILDKLAAEREVHSNYRNLVVSATGTGKTVIAAFDYKRFKQKNPHSKCRLLFVAHRKEILQQSISVFRNILRDQNFGEELYDGSIPESHDYLFASIQSLNSKRIFEKVNSNFYDFIIIDEFHHASANSYQKLLSYFQPNILLGLTATPERADGKDITQYFNRGINAEIRLSEAIDNKLLSPFHYFGVSDSTDISKVKWINGKFDESELEKVYVLDKKYAENRVSTVINAIEQYCTDTNEIIGIGFCVSNKHAKFMADRFNSYGIPSEFLTYETKDELRNNIRTKLTSKEINFVFVVDLFNEGVDIPEINTVLFLRPTESLTVYIQQLGRGLRLHEDKEVLTVLDFVGQYNKQYRIEDRLTPLLSKSRDPLKTELKNNFPNVPRGCSIQFEKVAYKRVLASIENAIVNKKRIRQNLNEYFSTSKDTHLGGFLEHYNLHPNQIYKLNDGSYYSYAVQDGLIPYGEIKESRLSVLINGLKRISSINSKQFLLFGKKYFSELKSGNFVTYNEVYESRLINMWFYTFWNESITSFKNVDEAFSWLLDDELCFKEVNQLIEYQLNVISSVSKPVDISLMDCPIEINCNYTRNQILAAFGKNDAYNLKSFREGVLWLENYQTDLLFITFNKTDKHFSDSTRYHDYVINEHLLHWQSQNKTTVNSLTGNRYINHSLLGTKILVFVRNHNKDEHGLSAPFTCIGYASYRSHKGNAPISIEFDMSEEIPASILKYAAKL